MLKTCKEELIWKGQQVLKELAVIRHCFRIKVYKTSRISKENNLEEIKIHHQEYRKCLLSKEEKQKGSKRENKIMIRHPTV